MAANQAAILHSGGDIMSEERDWRFGQLLPVILLALPLLSIWESYAGKWREISRTFESEANVHMQKIMWLIENRKLSKSSNSTDKHQRRSFA